MSTKVCAKVVKRVWLEGNDRISAAVFQHHLTEQSWLRTNKNEESEEFVNFHDSTKVTFFFGGELIIIHSNDFIPVIDSYEDFIKKLQMTDEEKEAFEEAFDERKSMKSFSIDNVEKHLEKAYREISDIDIIKRVEKDTAVANIIANQDSKSSSGDVSKPKTRTDRLLEEAEDFFKTYGKF